MITAKRSKHSETTAWLHVGMRLRAENDALECTSIGYNKRSHYLTFFGVFQSILSQFLTIFDDFERIKGCFCICLHWFSKVNAMCYRNSDFRSWMLRFLRSFWYNFLNLTAKISKSDQNPTPCKSEMRKVPPNLTSPIDAP